MAVGDNQIRPTVVVEVQRRCAPPHVLCAHRQTAFYGLVGKIVLAPVVIERGRVVGEVCLEYVQHAIMRKICRRYAHAGLFGAVVAVCNARLNTYLFEQLSTEIVVIKARRRVTRDINIRPTVVIEVSHQRTKAVIHLCCCDMKPVGDVGKMTLFIVLVKRDRFARQTARAAHHRQTLPPAFRLFSGMWRLTEIEIDIVRYHQIEKSIAIEVDEGTSGTPSPLRRGQSSLFCLVAESSVSLVVVQNVLSPLGYEQIDMTIVVDITRTYALSPTFGMRQTCFFGNVLKLQAAQIVIKRKWGGHSFVRLQPAAIDHKNVGQPVVIVVDDGNPQARRFDDVEFSSFRPGSIDVRQTRFRRYVPVVDDRRLHSGWQRLRRHSDSAPGSHSHLRLSMATEEIQQHDHANDRKYRAAVIFHHHANCSVRGP